MSLIYLIGLLALTVVGYVYGRSCALAAGKKEQLHSRPGYHGAFVALMIFLPMFAVFAIGMPVAETITQNRTLAVSDPAGQASDLEHSATLRDVRSILAGTYPGDANESLKQAAEVYASTRTWSTSLVFVLGFFLGLSGLVAGSRLILAKFRARNHVERVIKVLLFACATVAVLTTLGIVLSVLFESIRFFEKVPILEFLFGLQWSPQTALRADQGGSSGAFGIIPLVTGTLLITVIAMLVAAPIGLFAAIYLAEYASPRFRSWAKPVLEILAGVPTVVLGFFAALTLAPVIRDLGQAGGLNVASESALAAGLVMGMMIIPFISSLSDDVINAVPQSLRDGSYAMGATKSETVKKVVLPAAFSGIVAAMMLAISRAVGETMIVVMAAGLAANLTLNPLEAVTTFTVQIKTILVGDQEFDSAKTLAAFALGLVLFFFTLALNVIALQIVKRYREQYD
jgi:phosphate transport system permease protein